MARGVFGPAGYDAPCVGGRVACAVTGIHEITRERRAITPDTALRLARYFGTTLEFWMELQSVYDLRRAEVVTSESISREVTPRQAA
ncbi:MAG: HigA family addiction module antitoxin [Acidithiobacillus sp.]|uniref:HigA family addiction module antitoxin n=1 Tax=Acidithiobacillus sp. TaxID=1872118 RepID=UPI00355F341A